MAKLSAHGKEVVRFREVMLNPFQDELTQPFHVIKLIKYHAFFEDRRLLTKVQVEWNDGQKHDYGWKRAEKLKPSITWEGLKSLYLNGGWEIV